jgi:hypothetical protein
MPSLKQNFAIYAELVWRSQYYAMHFMVVRTMPLSYIDSLEKQLAIFPILISTSTYLPAQHLVSND